MRNKTWCTTVRASALVAAAIAGLGSGACAVAQAASAADAAASGPAAAAIRAFEHRLALGWFLLCVGTVLILVSLLLSGRQGYSFKRHWGGFGGSSSGWQTSPALVQLLVGSTLAAVGAACIAMVAIPGTTSSPAAPATAASAAAAASGASAVAASGASSGSASAATAAASSNASCTLAWLPPPAAPRSVRPKSACP